MKYFLEAKSADGVAATVSLEPSLVDRSGTTDRLLGKNVHPALNVQRKSIIQVLHTPCFSFSYEGFMTRLQPFWARFHPWAV